MQPSDHLSDTDRSGIAVTDALCALPLEQPDQCAWQKLSQSLSAPATHQTVVANARRRQRRLRWLAVAAVLALAIAAPSLWQPASIAPNGGETVATTAPMSSTDPAGSDNSVQRVSALQRESAQLEALLSMARDDTVISSTGDALRDDLTERVQWVDAMITDPQTSSATQLPLWQERILLLRRLATVEGGERLMAVNGEAETSRLVMAF